MCHAYVVWEVREKGAAAREPLRFIPQFRWGHDVPKAATGPRRLRLPALPAAPGWLRPALAAAAALAIVVPFIA